MGSLLFFLFAFGAVQSVSTNLSLNSGSEGSSSGGTSVQGSDAARLAGLLYVSFGFGEPTLIEAHSASWLIAGFAAVIRLFAGRRFLHLLPLHR